MVALADQISALESYTHKLNSTETIMDKERKRLRTFNTIIIKANESDSQKELIQNLLNSCVELVNFDIGSIYLVKDKNIKVVATRFIPGNLKEELKYLCNDRPELHDLFHFNKVIYLTNYSKVNQRVSMLLGDIETFLSIPIIFDNRVRGCINLAAYENHASVDPEICDMLRTLGKHLGHVLYRFELETELENKIIELESYNQELRASAEELKSTIEQLTQTHNEMANFV
jgi:transcriptional regulator with GAF, ATPase, and Fis domain